MNDFFKNYKGWIAAGVVILALIVLGVTGGSNKKSSSSPSLSLNKELQTKCLAEVNDSKFCKFAATFANVGSYNATMTETTESGNTQAQISIASNGNSSMTVTQNAAGVSTTSKIVVYNGITYLQDPSDKKWLSYKAGDTNAPSIVDIKKEIAKGDFKNTSGQKDQYINKGTESINGKQCYKYQIIDPSQTSQTGYMWFDTKDYLLRKMTTKDASMDLAMTFNYGSVNIAQPSPVKGSASE